ncbi:plancitoxin-1-like [Dermacentor andersoni]|uniref:plancitoxin-1-like n=1 Tax=Dermacentor andersoni TaxID=34620 RepID=UPI002155C2FE|nr:plancitoxin-1-like [Dermacentor andersoni]
MATFHISAQLVVIGTCVSFYGAFVNAKLSCKDAKGNDVDWFVVYKIPKTKPDSRSFKQPDGGEMAYFDSTYTSTTSPMWTLYDNIYSKKPNPIKETLAPIYKKKSNVAFVAYNDQPPRNFNGTRGGHTKGVLMVGKARDIGAVWLQHSVPQFVQDVGNDYLYPENGRENGQLFLCITFPIQDVERIAYHLHVQAINVYQRNLQKWARAFPYFWALLNKNYLRNIRHLQINLMLTHRRRLVLAISKPTNWPKDIYTEELRNKMNSSITVQSWRNGAGNAQTQYCTKGYSVTDVETIRIQTKQGSIYFSSREDHSKWYVAWKSDIFCASSLNRMLSQMKRGGGITCIWSKPLAVLFRNSIDKRSRCKAE